MDDHPESIRNRYYPNAKTHQVTGVIHGHISIMQLC